MTTSAAAVSQKLWNYCNVLRDAGLSCGDPNDEPASALLARIKAEREAAKASESAKPAKPRTRRKGG